MTSRAWCFVFLVLAALAPQRASAGPTLLFEPATGKVLYAEDHDDQWHPASLTKIMTAYLTFEAIKAGRFTLDSNISYGEVAHAQPPSKIGLPVGAQIGMDLALKSLIIKSANDIAVALAEAVGGSEAAFVEKMNATAKRLGMTRTRFINPHGLPAPEQVTTARDLAKLARAVVRDFPEYNHYWSLTEMQIGKIRIGSHNNLLKTYDGTDGLKTGFICDSGYNVVASATRDSVRLMAVVLGESTSAERNVRAQALLEHGQSTLGWKGLFSRDTIDNMALAAGAKGAASIRTSMIAIECGNRRMARVAQARQRAKQRAKAEIAAKGAAPAKSAKAAGAKATASVPAKTAVAPATAQTKTQASTVKAAPRPPAAAAASQ